MSRPTPTRPTDRHGFEIVIICALKVESDAVEASFDGFWEEDEDYDRPPSDPNTYTFGWIGRHNVVLAYMPSMGQTSSAHVSAFSLSSFPHIRLGLVVGVCGGVPQPVNLDHGIFIGDVIVSTDIIQTYLGRQYDDRFEPKDTLKDVPGRQNAELRSFLRRVQGWHGSTKLRNQTRRNIDAVGRKRRFRTWVRAPTEDEDRLYSSSYRHKHHDPASGCQVCARCLTPDDPVCEVSRKSTCGDLGCSEQYLIPWSERNRPPVDQESDESDGHGNNNNNNSHHHHHRAIQSGNKNNSSTTTTITMEPNPEIYFGTIISGNSVVKSARYRDDLANRHQALAFEMEGNGAWDIFPTIVVKGVCDYADSHKAKAWQEYASVTAASVTKALLTQWSGTDRSNTNSSSGGNRSKGQEQEQFVFNNHAGVQNQAVNQTVHGGMTFGGGTVYASPSPTFSGVNWGSQTGVNFGLVSNNDFRRGSGGRGWIERDRERQRERDGGGDYGGWGGKRRRGDGSGDSSEGTTDGDKDTMDTYEGGKRSDKR